MIWYWLDGCHVAQHCRHWAHAPVIHAASHFYYEKRVAWVSIPMHACDPVPIVLGLCLAALWAAGAPLKSYCLVPGRRALKQTPWDVGVGRWEAGKEKYRACIYCLG